MKKALLLILVAGVAVIVVWILFWKRIQVFVLPRENWIPLTLAEAKALSCNRQGVVGVYKDQLVLCENDSAIAARYCKDDFDCSGNPGSTGYRCRDNHVCYHPAGQAIGQRLDRLCEDASGKPYSCN